MDIKALIQECIEEVIAEAKRICAYCGKTLGEIPGDKDSHGICPSCIAIENEKEAKRRAAKAAQSKQP